ncbi:MAG: DNA mismatch repair protein MutT [Nitrospirae bacterium RIFCSPLOWO2_02_FULL_62_14]|nr:MAG: DNA mismatch repair protein MutT [Nitrospirae bacterium RIFCSPLOWO2_02_FULL_62_14]OGX09174.1 MAG: DNA mismatch repair protein MutT [Nitrospirae bacterium RIFCSPLOWO2_12_FULL_63_8]
MTRKAKPRAPHSSPLIQVAAGLIVREGRYLIARRKIGTHLGGLWEFPGGKCEPGESLEDCLRRELREELGIDVSAPVHFRTIRHDYPEKTVELHFFRCAISRGEALALDCEEIRWVMPDEMTDYEFPPADRPLVEALQQEGERIADGI